MQACETNRIEFFYECDVKMKIIISVRIWKDFLSGI
jgi:hypothetical protein